MVYCRKMKRQHDSNLSSNWDLNTFYIQIYFPELKTSGQWTIKIPLPSKYVIFVMRSVYIDSFSFVLFTNFSCCTHTRYIQQNKIRTPKKNLKSIHLFSTIITEMFMCALCKLNLTKMTPWRCLTCWPVKLWRCKMTSLVNKSGDWTPNYHKILIFFPTKIFEKSPHSQNRWISRL